MKRLNNKGNITVIFCIAVTAIFGFTAFVTDIGLIYAEKINLSNAIDSAALAAALELPNNDEKATAVAIEYLQKNKVDPNKAAIIISEDHKSIQINEEKDVKHLFAQIIGIKSSKVKASTKAIIAPARAASGLRPFAVVKYDFAYGERVTLKAAAGDGYDGNYGAVVLGGQGANVFLANALYGYKGTVSVGDYINTEPGNMAGACSQIQSYINTENSTFDNYPRNSIRLWTLPLVNTLTVSGQKSVQVVGFAKFYVEYVSGQTGKVEISGRFVRYVSNGPIDMNLDDTGVYGAKLSN